MNRKNIIYLNLILLTLFSCRKPYFQQEFPRSSPGIGGPSEYERTQIIIHPEIQISPGSNYIYCASFQLAWNKLISDFTSDKPIVMENGPDYIDLLNRRSFSENDLGSDSYYVNAGYIEKGIVNEIKKDMKKKFPSEGNDYISTDLTKGIFIYSYLCKDLLFDPPFDGEKHILFNDKTPVKAFGFDSSQPNKNFEKSVVYYPDFSGTLICLKSAESDDEIYLAEMDFEESLTEGACKVLSWTAEHEGVPFIKESTLLIPKLKFNLEHHYSELEGHYINNLIKYPLIEEALQNIEFSLDESGARLRSRVKISMAKSAGGHDGYYAVFNEPFLVIMKERGSAEPYLLLWIDNTEFMITE